MHILLAADQYPEYLNGAGAFTERLATGLVGRGHEVTVVYPSAHGPRRSGRRDGLTEHRVPSVALPRGHGLRVSLPTVARLDADRVLADRTVDVVHVQSHFPVGRAVVAAARSARVPVVATNHFMPENLLPHIPLPAAGRRLLGEWAWDDLGRVFTGVDLLTTPTPRAADLLVAKTRLPRAEVVSNGVDLHHFTPRAPTAATDDSDPFVLFVGRLEEEKRVDDLLHAFARVPGTTAARLVYVGTGSRGDALRAAARELGVADRVEFWGNVSDDELRRAYAACAVFCAPGIAELQSLVTLEAIASGAPVVAADAMALPHLVRGGHNGFLFPPGDVPELGRRLGLLLADRTLRSTMGAESRRLAELHSFEHTLDLFSAHYRRLVATIDDPMVRTAAVRGEPLPIGTDQQVLVAG